MMELLAFSVWIPFGFLIGFALLNALVWVEMMIEELNWISITLSVFVFAPFALFFSYLLYEPISTSWEEKPSIALGVSFGFLLMCRFFGWPAFLFERLGVKREQEMEDKPMVLTRRQKQALLTMVADKPKFSEMSEEQQRYAKAKAARILDEKAARASSLRKAGELNYGQDHNSSNEE